MTSFFPDGGRSTTALCILVASLTALSAPGAAIARLSDPDQDGLGTRFERLRAHTNPHKYDTDGDGLDDRRELRRLKTNPRRRDTDGDGVSDRRELRRGTNPRKKPRRARRRALVVPVTVTPTTDTSAPETTMTGGPAATATTATASFSFSSSEAGSSFECLLDTGVWMPCSSPHPLSGLANGTHTFSVRATDAANNTESSPASRSWQVQVPVPPPPPPPDTIAPETTITSGPSGTAVSASATFAFSSSEPGSSFQCRLDGGAWGSCGSPRSYSGLSNGSHTFDVRSTDGAQNTDFTPAARTWTVEVAPPPPPPPPSGDCTLNVTTVTFPAAYNSAAANAVLCLASGSYGTFRGSLRSSPVTLRSQAGAAPGMTLNFNPASNITIDGLRLNDVDLADARTRNITVRNSDIPGQTTLRTGQLQNANVLFDNNVHRDWDKCDSCGEGRVWLPEKTGQPSGITIQNSEFRGGLSDGIQNGSRGTRIIGNEFHQIESGSAAGVHADAIQLYGSAETLIRANWFHDLPSGVGLIMAADGIDHEVIEDNVFGRGLRRPWLDLWSDNGSIVRHNTLVDGACEYNQRCGQISLSSKPADDRGTGTLIENNILTSISAQSGAAYTARSNLVAGSPVFIGGPNPSSYEGFKLAPGSPGKGAGSDGLDLGARFP